jgi:Lysylphosphatidylglycerol synthase TM region
LKLGLACLLFYNLYSKFSGDEFPQAVELFKKEFSWSKIHFLFLAIILTFFNWGFETWKFFICIQRVENISFWRAYKGILFGNAMNLILPASIGELTGRPMVLREENRVSGSGVAYYVSIVQKVASPLVGMIFLTIAYCNKFLSLESITILGLSMKIATFIAFISILDIIFWLLMYLFPSWMIDKLAKVKSLRSIFEKIGTYIHYDIRTKLKLLSIGSFRFLIFVTQYWLLMFLFFNDFPHLEFYVLCGVYFLAQFVIPSLGLLDVGIRANLVIFVFSLYTQNFVQLMAVNYLIWMINVLIPSLFGFYLMRKVINPFDKKT